MKALPKYDREIINEIENKIGMNIKFYALAHGISWRKAIKHLAKQYKIQLKHIKEEKESENPESFSNFCKSQGIYDQRTTINKVN